MTTTARRLAAPLVPPLAGDGAFALAAFIVMAAAIAAAVWRMVAILPPPP